MDQDDSAYPVKQKYVKDIPGKKDQKSAFTLMNFLESKSAVAWREDHIYVLGLYFFTSL